MKVGRLLVVLLVRFGWYDWEKSWSCGCSWLFCWSCSLSFWVILYLCWSQRGNDREKASVGRVVGSEFDTQEQKIDKIRSAMLVV